MPLPRSKLAIREFDISEFESHMPSHAVGLCRHIFSWHRRAQSWPALAATRSARCLRRRTPLTSCFYLNAACRLPIEELHRAIKDGRTTCVAVVRHYINRVRAFNGVASALVTQDGRPVPEASGAIRAMAPLRFPTQTAKASTVLPDLDK
jgi:hypothetical protein